MSGSCDKSYMGNENVSCAGQVQCRLEMLKDVCPKHVCCETHDPGIVLHTDDTINRLLSLP